MSQCKFYLGDLEMGSMISPIALMIISIVAYFL